MKWREKVTLNKHYFTSNITSFATADLNSLLGLSTPHEIMRRDQIKDGMGSNLGR